MESCTKTRFGYIWIYNIMCLYIAILCVTMAGTAYGLLTTCHFEHGYGCRDKMPPEQSSVTGWRLHKDNHQNSYAYASCVDKCVEHVALFKGIQSMMPTKWDVKFCYYLSTLDGAIETAAAGMRVIACGKNISVPLIEGVWKSESVRFSCSEPFDVGYEIHLDGALQRLALDEVIITDPYSKRPARQCSAFIPSLFDLHPIITVPPSTPRGSDVGHVTAVFGDKINPATDSLPPVFTDDEALVANASIVLPNKPSASEKTTPPPENSAQTLFDTIWYFFEDMLKNPLLLAEVLAIATVTVCCVTITIHCFIWRKQRRSYRLHKTRSIRAQRYLARDMSSSDMLLDMTVHDNDCNLAPLSRSSSKDALSIDRKKLKPTKHATDRRATVSNGSGSGSGSCEDIAPRPHPRTKSLPNRPPTNVYETIDEVRKNALHPVQEGDDEKNLSHSFPTLVENKAPEPPKSRRHAKSCREKRDRKHKKSSKKQTKKQSKIDAKENKLNQNEQHVISTRDTAHDVESVSLQVGDGHLYDRLGRTNSHPDFTTEDINDLRKNDRLSLSVDVNRSPKQKQVSFRQRAYSQNQGSAEWNPPSPRLTQQNMQINGGVSRELNSVAESNYFTLEPIAIPHRNANAANRSSSELSDEMMIGSVDTLQEELIISNNHTDSFKRSVVNGDQKTSRPNSTEMSNAFKCQASDIDNTPPTIIVVSADNSSTRDTNENEFANRTYQTLEPPYLHEKLHHTQSSEETHF